MEETKTVAAEEEELEHRDKSFLTFHLDIRCHASPYLRV